MKIGIKIFKSFSGEEEQKIQETANRTVNKRMRHIVELQKVASSETFDSVTGKRKPIERKITFGKIKE